MDRFDLVHIDNVHFDKKETIGATVFEISKDGLLCDSPKNCVYNPVKAFGIMDEVKLIISRAVFKFNLKPEFPEHLCRG